MRCKSSFCNQIKRGGTKEEKKNKGGRPLLFKTVKELEDKINEYFEDKNNRPYTITSLAVWLDCDRKTLTNYEERDKFFPTIKRAKTKIEAEIEKGALLGLYNPTFSIFNMKNNFGWQDKQEVDTVHTNRIKIINDLPKEEK